MPRPAILFGRLQDEKRAPLTRTEIDELVRAAEDRGAFDSLAVEMDRTPDAVVAKARRLSLPVPPTRVSSDAPASVNAPARNGKG
jgi:hypothetical protein